MNKKTIYSAIACMAVFSQAAEAQVVQKISANKSNDYALVYELPTTALDITVEAECTVKKVGELALYAKKYLPSDKPITKESQHWTLKSITVSPRGIANGSKPYTIQFKAGNPVYVMLNDANLPIGINTEKTITQPVVTLPTAQPAQPTALETAEARQAVTEEMLQSQSMAKRAELAAAQIFALRQSRNEIITGQADQLPPDGKAMELVLNNLSAQEAALTAMFLGTTQTFTDVATYTYTPDKQRTNDVVARISDANGIVDPDDLSGRPIYITLNVTEEPKIPVNEKGIEKDIPKNGVTYSIPAPVQVTMTYNGKKMMDSTIPMSQFGLVFALDPSMFTDKKAPSYIILDPTTGGIKELGAISQQ